MIRIRAQRPDDIEAIERINENAFAEHGGTAAFDTFRRERDDIVSLVAEQDGNLVGHVLFSPVTLAAPQGPVAGMGLGQLAVDPPRQNTGIGTALAEHGIAMLRDWGCPFVIVIGHAKYYPRFGFEPGSGHGFVCQWKGIPDETFMVMFPDKARRSPLSGVASFDGL